MSAIGALKAKASERDTETLMGALLLLEAKPQLSEDERMVKASISDVIEERHGLTDLLDTIYSDDAYAGTYTDALVVALAAKEVTAAEEGNGDD